MPFVIPAQDFLTYSTVAFAESTNVNALDRIAGANLVHIASTNRVYQPVRTTGGFRYLNVWNISTPATPTEVGLSTDSANSMLDITAYDDDYLVSGAQSDGFWLWDLTSDIDDPDQLGISFLAPSSFYHTRDPGPVGNDLLCQPVTRVTGTTPPAYQLAFWDMSTPTVPNNVSVITDVDDSDVSSFRGRPFGHGDRVFIGCTDGILVLDLSTPASPSVVTKFVPSGWLSTGMDALHRVDADHVVVSGPTRIAICDISSGLPVVVGECGADGDVMAVGSDSIVMAQRSGNYSALLGGSFRQTLPRLGTVDITSLSDPLSLGWGYEDFGYDTDSVLRGYDSFDPHYFPVTSGDVALVSFVPVGVSSNPWLSGTDPNGNWGFTLLNMP